MNSEEILDRLDKLVMVSSDTALEFGWLSNEYFEAEKPNLISEFGTEAAALHETITFIHDREASYIVARSTVADRMRVCRYMTRERYNDIVAETGTYPSFHQLRACLVTDDGTVLVDKTDEMVIWCVSEGWPPVAVIRDHRSGEEPMEANDAHWKRLVKLALTVSLDVDNSIGRYEAAAKVLEQDGMEAGHGTL